MGAGVGIRAEASPRGDRAELSVLHAVGWQPPRPPVHPEDKGAVELVVLAVLAFVAATPAPPGKPDYPTPTSHSGVSVAGVGIPKRALPALAICRIMQPPPFHPRSPPQLALKLTPSVPPAHVEAVAARPRSMSGSAPDTNDRN